VGELRTVWRKLTAPGARCGCGEQLVACPVWSGIIRSALGEPWAALARETWHCQREAVGELHTWLRVPFLLRRRGHTPPAGTRLARYAESLARLYRAIAEETGAEVIVDSSKEPSDAALLLCMPGINAAFAHIVRDPRGTVYSIVRHRAGGQPVLGSRLRQSTYAALSWQAGNLAATAVRRAAGPSRSMLLRHEDFAAHPGQAVQALTQLAGRPAQPSLLPSGTVNLQPTHTVGGNPNRFRTGPVKISVDAGWRSRMHPRDQAAVTTICAPLMAHYGYRLTR
jgi:Sulfotransferase family